MTFTVVVGSLAIGIVCGLYIEFPWSLIVSVTLGGLWGVLCGLLSVDVGEDAE
jgi:hypothetical protein